MTKNIKQYLATATRNMSAKEKLEYIKLFKTTAYYRKLIRK